MKIFKFTKDGINPTPWNINKMVTEAINNDKKVIKFANPLVLEILRVFIKEGKIKDSDIKLEIYYNNEWVVCPFVGKMWVLPDYKNFYKDLHKTYPYNEYLNIHEELMMKLL